MTYRQQGKQIILTDRGTNQNPGKFTPNSQDDNAIYTTALTKMN